MDINSVSRGNPNNKPQKTGVRSLSVNAGFLVFSKTAEKGIRFIYLLVLARFLGPDMLGLYNYGLAWYLIFLPLACWGLGDLLSIHLGRRPVNAEDIVSATLIIRMLTTAVFTFCCFVIGILNHDDVISRSVISIFMIALMGRSLAIWGRSCFIAVELSHYSAGLEIGFRLVESVCGLIYLLFGGNIFGLCIIHSACWVGEGVVALGLVRSRLSFRKKLVPLSFLRSYAIEALPITVNIFLMMIFLQSGFVVLKHVSMDSRAVGFYAVGFQLVFSSVLISEAFGQAALPILSRAVERGAREQIVFLEAMLKICLFCSGILILFVIVYDKDIIRLLFGEKYLMASDVLVICSFSMITYYALPFANVVLRAGCKYIVSAVNLAVGLTVNIVLSVYLVPEIGAKAPAVGLVVGGYVSLILHLIAIQRGSGKISWWQAVMKPYISVVFSCIVTWSMKEFGMIGFGAGLVVLGGCYTGWKIITPLEVGYFTKTVPWIERN